MYFFFKPLVKSMGFLDETFHDADANKDGQLDKKEMESAMKLGNLPEYFTVGRSGCPYTVKQAQSNNANGVMTILCGDPSVFHTLDAKYQNICQTLPTNLEGVPANFTCKDDDYEPSSCTPQYGFNPDFGKKK